VTVLVAVASKHGSTRGIAEAIADELGTLGLEADLRDLPDPVDPEGYDAVVLGSAVYAGRWLDAARRFAETHRDALGRMPVWLFSSGPLGGAPDHPVDPREVDRLMAATGARGHHTFAGRIEPTELGFGERLVAKAVCAPAGDFRDWDAVRGWARGIGGALGRDTVTAGATDEPVGPA
jgi:menaquinone-dependent protoporphyrinogen oxidase